MTILKEDLAKPRELSTSYAKYSRGHNRFPILHNDLLSPQSVQPWKCESAALSYLGVSKLYVLRHISLSILSCVRNNLDHEAIPTFTLQFCTH